MKCGGDNSGCELFTDSFSQPNPNCRHDEPNENDENKEKKDKPHKSHRGKRGRSHRKHAQKIKMETQGNCGNETITIFQVPSGATHLTLSQNATANNFIRKSYLMSKLPSIV